MSLNQVKKLYNQHNLQYSLYSFRTLSAELERRLSAGSGANQTSNYYAAFIPFLERIAQLIFKSTRKM